MPAFLSSSLRTSLYLLIIYYYIAISLVIPNIPANAHWSQNGVTAAGGNGKGNARKQLYDPHGLFILMMIKPLSSLTATIIVSSNEEKQHEWTSCCWWQLHRKSIGSIVLSN